MSWMRVSVWAADESRDAVTSTDRVRIDTGSNSIEAFWLEYNSSGRREGGETLWWDMRGTWLYCRASPNPSSLFSARCVAALAAISSSNTQHSLWVSDRVFD